MKNIVNKIKTHAIALAAMAIFLAFGNVAAVSQNLPDLELVLEKLNQEYETVTSVIPNRYDFYDGVTGYYISDGGDDMYDGGNYLGTNLGGSIFYSDNQIAYSAKFGGEGKYFTRKYQGLFVLAADIENISMFEIYGDLGADGAGQVDGTVLTSGGYTGFVKRVFDSNDAAVNHIIITKSDPNITQSFPGTTDYDDHSVSPLSNTSRLYYLLFSGTNGYYCNNAAAQQILDAFVDILAFDTIAPGAPANLAIQNVLNDRALATWTAPSDDTSGEPVSAYDIRLDTEPITAMNFDDAPVYQNNIVPSDPGMADSLVIQDLIGETQYWIGVRALDEANNHSSAVFSNFTTGTDPAIAVSVEELEFMIATGNQEEQSFTISNAAQGATPLSFSIETDIAPMNDVYSWILSESGLEVYRLNLLDNSLEIFPAEMNMSVIEAAVPSGDLWFGSQSYKKVIVRSADDFSRKASFSAINLIKICVPKNSDKAFIFRSGNQLNVDVYDIHSFELDYTLNLSTYYYLRDLSVTPDGNKICILDQSSDLNIYNAQNGQLLSEYSLNADYEKLVISPDGQFAYCTSWSGDIARIDLQNMQTQSIDVGIQITHHTLNHDGSQLFVMLYGSNGGVMVFDTQTMNLLYSFPLISNYGINDMEVSADGKLLYAIDETRNRLTVYDLHTKLPVSQKDLPGGGEYLVFMGGFSGYIQVAPRSGLIDATNNQEIVVTVNGSLAIPGTYQSMLHIHSNDPVVPQVDVPLQVTIEDVTGPDFGLSFFHNPYLTDHLKVIVFAHEKLDGLPQLQAGSENLTVEALDSLNFIYFSAYQLTSTQDITFTVTGSDSLGNQSTYERTLSSTQAFKNAPVVADYVDGSVELNISGGMLPHDMFITIWKEEANDESVYHIGPESFSFNDFSVLEMSYAGKEFEGMEPNHLAVYRMNTETGQWELSPTVYNPAERLLKAEIYQTGKFRIGYDPALNTPEEHAVPATSLDLSISPNPVNSSAVITFENIVEGQVQVVIYDLSGNKILTAIDEEKSAGLVTVMLNGKSFANGTYVCKVVTAGGEAIRRFVIVR